MAKKTLNEDAVFRSDAANDVRWFYGSAAAAMGFRAMNPEPGPGGGSITDKTWRTQGQLDAVRRERGIREALAKLDTDTVEVLRMWAESKRHDKEIHERLGEYAELCMRSSRCARAYGAYLEAEAVKASKGKRAAAFSYETWLAIACKHGDDVVAQLREDAETVVSTALTAYQTAAGGLVPQPKAPRAPRGPNKENGVPFMPDDDHVADAFQNNELVRSSQ